MRIGVPQQSEDGETRAALTPAAVAKLVGRGIEVIVESEAGVAAGYGDDAYAQAGARVVSTPDEPSLEVWESDLVVAVRPPSNRHLDAMKPHAVLVGGLPSARDSDIARQLEERRLTGVALGPEGVATTSGDACSKRAEAVLDDLLQAGGPGSIGVSGAVVVSHAAGLARLKPGSHR